MILIASFDPGFKNFAFIIEKVDENKLRSKKSVALCGETILAKNKDLTYNCKKGPKNLIDPQLFVNITQYLNTFEPLFDMVSVFLIEKQMSFGRNTNAKALRISQHIVSWITERYGTFKEIIDFPAFHKTQVLNAPKKMNKPQRKKWSSQIAFDIWKKRGDNERVIEMSGRGKKDDVSDCLLMCVAFCKMRWILRKI